MTKDTFLNLPEAKRQLIEESAIDEFAAYGFDNASINRIVAAAGIAKGSFYQYFDDKIDLYMHIIGKISQQKMAYMTPIMMNPAEHDFFVFLEELYRVGLAYGKDNLKMGQIGFEVYKNKTNPLFKQIYQDSKTQATGFFEPLIKAAISRGEINEGIDIPFVIHMLMDIQVSSFDYYFETVRGGEGELVEFNDDIMPTIHLMINFIKKGIQPQQTGVRHND